MPQKLNISMYQQGNFYRVPKVLIQGERYEKLTSDAKLLYAVFQDRAELSIQNKWMDINGDIFFLFSIEEVCFFMGWGKDKVIKVKKELIRYNLLSEKRRGRNLVNKIYLHLVDTNTKNRKFISKGSLVSEIELWFFDVNTIDLKLNNTQVEIQCIEHIANKFGVDSKYVKNFISKYNISFEDLIKTISGCISSKDVWKSEFQNNQESSRKSEKATSRDLDCRQLEICINDSNNNYLNDNKRTDDDKLNIIKVKTTDLEHEIMRIINRTPELIYYMNRIMENRSVSIENRYYLVDQLDSCWQYMLYERNNDNRVILNEKALFGETAMQGIFERVFDEQLEYTRNNCRYSEHFLGYFFRGLKKRLESKLF